MTVPVSGPAQPAGATRVAGDLSRLPSKDNLKAAGDRFEAVFTNMMLGAMRKARLSETMFDSKAQETFRDMQDQKLSESMAASAPIGIGRALTDFLSKNQPDLNQPASDTAT